LNGALESHQADPSWTARAAAEAGEWAREVARVTAPVPAGELTSQASVIAAVNDAAGETGVVVCAAGSMPGDLHKLWRARDPEGKGYHVEYGYSCMGYEIPGGMGIKLAAPEREVFVMIGDASYLMLPAELATAVAEGVKLTIVLVDNHGYASIGALSRSVGGGGFGTIYRAGVPVDDDPLPPALPVDLATNAESLGARVFRAKDAGEVRDALASARDVDGPVVIHIETDRYHGVPSYEGWWDVPVAEVSDDPGVQAARDDYERAREAQRPLISPAATPEPARR
jgi:3D-(3,5/4)-trihydroxycyclohexane-1,2-dione acylhydrolase (decyclizing)